MRWIVLVLGGLMTLLPGVVPARVVSAQGADEPAAASVAAEVLTDAGWTIDDPAENLDADLVFLLAAAGLLEDWDATSPTVPALTFVRVIGDEYDQARDDLRQVLTDRSAAAAELGDAENDLQDLTRRRLAAVRNRRRAETSERSLANKERDLEELVESAEADLDHARTTLQAIAIARYMGDNLADSLSVVQTGKVATSNRRTWILEATDDDYYVMIDDLTGELAELDQEQQLVDSAIADNDAYLVEARADIDDVDLEIDAAEGIIDNLEVRLRDRRIEARELLPELHDLRMTSKIDGLRVSVVAIDSYIRAMSVVTDEGPECAMDWAALGGVGRVESHHGTYLDRAVLANGDLDDPLFGILLAPAPTPVPTRATNPRPTRREGGENEDGETVQIDGAEEGEGADGADEGEGGGEPAPVEGDGADPGPEPAPVEETAEPTDSGTDDDGRPVGGSGLAVVVDTDGGALDGNAQYDRAVGPMQFLPETWQNFAVDGNGDGETNPQNMYDATATAANYLCYLGGRFETGDFGRRLLGYNASSAYVDQVLTSGTELRSYQLPIVSS